MSEYLSEEEQLEQLRSWWMRYGIGILLGLVLAVGGYFGWQWYQGHIQDKAAAASRLYQSWLDAGTDKAKQEAALKALESDAPQSSYLAFVQLREAAVAVEAGELEKAEATLRSVVDGSVDPLLRNLASLRLASVLQALDRSDDALKLLDRVTGAGYKSLALELKGDIHQARGEQGDAHTAYTAAMASLEDGQKDPLLEAKANDSAPVPGAEKATETAPAGKSDGGVEEVDAVEDEAATAESPSAEIDGASVDSAPGQDVPEKSATVEAEDTTQAVTNDASEATSDTSGPVAEESKPVESADD